MSNQTWYKKINYDVLSVKKRSGWSRFWYDKYCDCEAEVLVDGRTIKFVFCSTLNGDSPRHNLEGYLEDAIVDLMENSQEDIDKAIPATARKED